MTTHGGKRKGAGRKPAPKKYARILITLPPHIREWLAKRENRSDYIAKLIEREMEKGS